MARILAIDYGKKRTGIAVTDPLQIIATGLTTISTPNLFTFLNAYFNSEEVETIIIGYPMNLDGQPNPICDDIDKFIRKASNTWKSIPIEKVDEQFTSKKAFQSMIDSGMKKKKRRDKKLIDEISATIILQDYLKNYS